MGALTSKIKEFTFRSWEPKTTIELDDTEIQKFDIRLDNLKTKRFRILPIGYWISDKKRFSKETLTVSNPSSNFISLQKLLFAFSKINMQTLDSFIISNVKGYFKISDKLCEKTNLQKACFMAKQFRQPHPLKLTIFNDLFLSQKIFRNRNVSFEVLKTNILLFTNPRLETPALNSYLLKKAEMINFISFSTFNSNYLKEELPYSSRSFFAILQGLLLISKSSSIISSCLDNIPQFPQIQSLICMPLYINRSGKSYTKNQRAKNDIIFNFSLRTKDLFSSLFLSNNLQHKPNISLINNVFDLFPLKKVNVKILHRLTLLSILLLKIKNQEASPC